LGRRPGGRSLRFAEGCTDKEEWFLLLKLKMDDLKPLKEYQTLE
jgi:hypothetical protein